MGREKQDSSRPRKTGKDPAGRELVLAVDRRVLYVGLAIVGLLSIFLAGVWLGRGPGSQVASVQQPGSSEAVEAEESSAMGVVTKQLPKGVDPNLTGYTPADPDAPLEGDQPRIAIPELGANHIYDLGEIPPDRPTEHVFNIKNTGRADLEIYEMDTR